MLYVLTVALIRLMKKGMLYMAMFRVVASCRTTGYNDVPMVVIYVTWLLYLGDQ